MASKSAKPPARTTAPASPGRASGKPAVDNERAEKRAGIRDDERAEKKKGR